RYWLSLYAPVTVRTTNLPREARTGHTNGCMGQSARTGVLPSQPAFMSAARPYSGGCGSKVHAVSVPSSVEMPSSLRTSCDSGFRVMTSDSATYRRVIHFTSGSMLPASAPYARDNLFCADANPSAPAKKVVSAFANLLLNIEPSHAITP